MPQASIEFEVADREALDGAAEELTAAGHAFCTAPARSPGDRSSPGCSRPRALIVGVSFAPCPALRPGGRRSGRRRDSAGRRRRWRSGGCPAAPAAADTVGERPLAASDDDREEEQLDLVDQPRRDRLPGELGAADAEVGAGAVLQRAHPVRVELPLDPGPRRSPTSSSVREKTILSAARQISANSRITAGSSVVPSRPSPRRPSSRTSGARRDRSRSAARGR